MVYMEKLNVSIMILPYMHPYGPVLSEYANLDKKTFINKYALTIHDTYIENLSLYARNYGINVVLPCIIEKLGPRKYVSTLLIPSDREKSVERIHKLILSKREESLGITRGKELKVFDTGEIKFSTLLDQEIFYPELARALLFESDFLIAGFPQNELVKNYLNPLRTISQINKAITIVPGSNVIVAKGTTSVLYYSSPTIIINNDGDIVFRYNEEEQAVIRIPLESLKRNNNVDRRLTLLYKTIYRYLSRRMR